MATDGPYKDHAVRVGADELMSAPNGLERSGDEFHDPANWQECRNCGLDCPADSTSCFNCGEPLA